MQRKLDFLIVGAQKGGTTALARFLRRHPSIYMPQEKELHFFDNFELDWGAPDYGKYHAHVVAAKPEQTIGEATPIYMFLEQSMRLIHAYCHNIKIIVLLRDPIARAFSHWRMETLRNRESLSFSEAIRGGRARIPRGRVDSAYRTFTYVERGMYAPQLKLIFDLFPESNVLLLETASLKAAQDKVLQRVTEFLGVEPYEVYPTPELIFSKERLLADRISPTDLALLQKEYELSNRILQAQFGIEFSPVDTQVRR